MFKHWGAWSFTKEKLTDRVLGIDGYHWEVCILILLIISGFSIFQFEKSMFKRSIGVKDFVVRLNFAIFVVRARIGDIYQYKTYILRLISMLTRNTR